MVGIIESSTSIYSGICFPAICKAHRLEKQFDHTFQRVDIPNQWPEDLTSSLDLL